MKHSLVLVLVIATGCLSFAPVPSSRAHLGPAGSEAVMRRPPATAALELTQLFTQRGFVLVVQQPTATGGVMLRLKGARKTVTSSVAESAYSVQYGSAFYVFIEPRGEAEAHVSIIGRATSDG